MKTPLIPVTEEIIRLASRANSGHCMIADAIRAAIPDARNITVDIATIRFSDRKAGKRYIWLTPIPIQKQIIRFDQGIVVKPFSFRLPVRPNQTVAVRSVIEGGRQIPPGKRTIRDTKVSKDAGVIQIEGGNPPVIAPLHHGVSGRFPALGRSFGVKALGEFQPYDPNS